MPFPDHTPDSAPPAARRALESVTERLGYRPAAVARLATSPHTLDGFLKISAIFESCTLDPLSREVLIMTMATRNDCHVCVAMHTAKLTRMGADPALLAALRDRANPPLPDERLEAVSRFTLEVLASAGAVDDAALRDFLSYGYTEQNALEVVLGIGAYTLSTLANRLTGAPVDAPLAAFA
ncbi:carboxymuconolactone decarboxylase family protein [Streptomyces cyaneofuscatus]|uniref:Carboxymuconolactone decarboxylase family protein n=1 Tax=Streptomyces cyaneofuscatus TaxID=66883 RepID=A0ABZ1ETB6_9ACTN|nr:carboxymuconolactone decarboxylase family protein [Streptomyces cyaneofuscatus]WSB07288.1 carboxymuconolactone decarboxylase family protein [Streptomyces cyaneofuscatus]WSD49178.1 carboxymuconolactone decarboxylase family protein [Streptomyces cyaneofuscatus]WTA92597.1 carboxymuconolactone decarboxylase family protein [Streptomyces cyaneofuscatus]